MEQTLYWNFGQNARQRRQSKQSFSFLMISELFNKGDLFLLSKAFFDLMREIKARKLAENTKTPGSKKDKGKKKRKCAIL